MSSSIKTPSEKVLEILLELKDYFDNMETIADIEWSMTMIASNKLYEPVLNEGGGDKGDLVNTKEGRQTAYYLLHPPPPHLSLTNNCLIRLLPGPTRTKVRREVREAALVLLL